MAVAPAPGGGDMAGESGGMTAELTLYRRVTSLGPRGLATATSVALVVTPILTLINQWDGIFGASTFDWLKMALTFAVPFLVSAISQILANGRRSAKAAQEVSADVNVSHAAVPQASAPQSSAADLGAADEPDPGLPFALDRFKALIEGAHDRGETIRTNAQRVNSSSKERAQFIAGLVERTEGLNRDIEQGLAELARGQHDVEAVQGSITQLLESLKKVGDSLGEGAVAEDAIRESARPLSRAVRGYRRGLQGDHGDRRQDQPAGFKRNDRGGARRRRGQGVRRGGRRGQGAGRHFGRRS